MSLEGLMREAARAYDAGDFASAEPLFLQIVGRNPRDADAWHVLASMALRAGRAAEALEMAMRAHRLDRRNPFYLNTLGVAHGELGHYGEALAWFNRALKERPTHAEAHYNLGKAYEKLDRAAEAERSYLRARQLEPGRPQAAHNLAALYLRAGRIQEALPLYAEAKRGLPEDEGVAIQSAIAALATTGAAAAIRELQSFLEQHPQSAAVHAELARRLLAEGRLAEGWEHYAWRSHAVPARLPQSVQGMRVLLQPDQGIGDHLFFLRFAESLRRQAARVAFACPSKLLPLLRGNESLAELCVGGCDPGDFDLALPVGDLPRLLRDEGTPPPLRVDASRLAESRERLAMLGPPPYLGVTWRGGSRPANPSEFAQSGEFPLHKEVPLEALATALRHWPGTVVVLQRLPAEGEITAFSRALGKRAHDLSSLNEKLEEMASVLSLIEDYTGVSNANMHIRAGVGRTAHVLIPFPPEFRWMHAGERSPWFPGFRLYRQSANRDWTAALDQLSAKLSH